MLGNALAYRVGGMYAFRELREELACLLDLPSQLAPSFPRVRDQGSIVRDVCTSM